MGEILTVRASPRSRRPVARLEAGVWHVAVAEPAAEGRANAAVRRALAEALGIAPSRLTLLRGARGRDKTFRLD